MRKMLVMMVLVLVLGVNAVAQEPEQMLVTLLAVDERVAEETFDILAAGKRISDRQRRRLLTEKGETVEPECLGLGNDNTCRLAIFLRPEVLRRLQSKAPFIDTGDELQGALAHALGGREVIQRASGVKRAHAQQKTIVAPVTYSLNAEASQAYLEIARQISVLQGQQVALMIGAGIPASERSTRQARVGENGIVVFAPPVTSEVPKEK